jgi:hypothetical protein
LPSSNPHITYAPCSDATPEAELNALATRYRFILFGGKASKQEAAESAQPDGREDHKKLAAEQRRLA